MELDMMQTTDKKMKNRKCFQCRRAGHDHRNYCSAREGNTLASLELGNRQGLEMEGARAKED